MIHHVSGSEQNCTNIFSDLSCYKHTGHKTFVLSNDSRAHICISINETKCMIPRRRPCTNCEQYCTYCRSTKPINTWKNRMELSPPERSTRLHLHWIRISLNPIRSYIDRSWDDKYLDRNIGAYNESKTLDPNTP